jgi:hypothetical protein
MGLLGSMGMKNVITGLEEQGHCGPTLRGILVEVPPVITQEPQRKPIHGALVVGLEVDGQRDDATRNLDREPFGANDGAGA